MLPTEMQHDGHGHFFYRRSKDLINWEFMGSSMTTAPAWVKDSLNNKRARMNPALPAIKILIMAIGHLVFEKWGINTECIIAL